MTPILSSVRCFQLSHWRVIPAATAAAVLLFSVTAAQAAATPEQKCQAGKNKLAGAYAACQANAEAKRATSGNAAKYTTAIGNCTAKFSSGWVKLEAKAASAGRTCLDGAPTADVFRPVISDHVGRVSAALNGAALQVCSSRCGNGIIDTPESCDGAQLGGLTCESLGFASGTLACTAGCGLNLTGCVPRASGQCGNGLINTPESCDGTELGGATCQSLGFASGTLACTAGCGFNLTGCVANAPDTCGNGTLESGETCDGAQLNDEKCSDQRYCVGTNFSGECIASLSYLGGTLRCGSGCAFDTAGCYKTRYEETELTVIDNEEGLEWEKKRGNLSDSLFLCVDDSGPNANDCLNDPRNVRRAYYWTDAPNTQRVPNGTAFGIFLGGLNGAFGRACMDSHCDWRLPTYAELTTIRNGANVASSLFGPNVSGTLGYLTNTTIIGAEGFVREVEFVNNPDPGASANKSAHHYVRAVRTLHPGEFHDKVP